MRQQGGFSIAELVVTLVVGSLVVALGVAGAGSLFRMGDVQSVRSKVDRMMAATNSFFDAHCQDDPPPSPDVAQLVSEGYLIDTTVADIPFGSDLQPIIDWSEPIAIQVQAAMDDSISIEAYRQKLGASRNVGSVLVWERVPSVRNSESGLWYLDEGKFYDLGNCDAPDEN